MAQADGVERLRQIVVREDGGDAGERLLVRETGREQVQQELPRGGVGFESSAHRELAEQEHALAGRDVDERGVAEARADLQEASCALFGLDVRLAVHRRVGAAPCEEVLVRKPGEDGMRGVFDEARAAAGGPGRPVRRHRFHRRGQRLVLERMRLIEHDDGATVGCVGRERGRRAVGWRQRVRPDEQHLGVGGEVRERGDAGKGHAQLRERRRHRVARIEHGDGAGGDGRAQRGRGQDRHRLLRAEDFAIAGGERQREHAFRADGDGGHGDRLVELFGGARRDVVD